MAKLADIATAFQLGHVESVSFITHQIRRATWTKNRTFDLEYCEASNLTPISNFDLGALTPN